MAYLKSCEYTCKSCGKRAVVVLVDRWNGERGEYCKRHGESALRQQNLNENPQPAPQ